MPTLPSEGLEQGKAHAAERQGAKGRNEGMSLFTKLIDSEIHERVAEARKNGWSVPELEEGQHTTGDFILVTMRIKEEATAREYFEGYVEWLRFWRETHPQDAGRFTVEQTAKANIGWCFGEGMEPEISAMWVRVCGASHPVFGTAIL